MSDARTPDGALRPSPLAAGLWTTTFPSGLRLVVQEDRRVPVAVANVWVRVGSNREPERLRGWSHGIEHMLFKGTARRGESDFALEVADAGGSTNAGTGYETTNYHVTVPAGRIGTALDILGDALLHSSFEPGSLDAERKVLVHENHMYDDIPFGFGVTWRWAMELAFDVSPYRHPIGGRDENLLERGRDEILAFWRSAYRPGNMTVVVVGDVQPDEIVGLVREHFPVEAGSGPAPADDPATAIVDAPPVEPPRRAPRCRLETGDIAKAYAKLVFPAPGEHAPERHALAVVRRVLGDGRSSRLYRRLVEELKLVDDLSVALETGPREGVMVIDLETEADRLAEAVTATTGVLAELARGSCTEAELSRAATRVRRGHLFGSETVQGQAASLGHADALGDLSRAFSLPAQIAAVRLPDVGAAAARVFRPERLAAVFYLPDGTDAAAVGIPADADALAALVAPTLGTVPPEVPAPPAAEPAPQAGRAGRGAAAGGGFRVVPLGAGTEVWLRRDATVPVATATFVIPGGATAETAADAGLSTLTRMVQIKGAGGRDSASLHEELEGMGASVSPLAQRDHAGLSLTCLTENLDRCLDLVEMIIREPDFPDHEVEQERRLALQQLASLQDNTFQAASLQLREMLYGDHPYGRPLPGTAASLPALARDQLLARHAADWNAANLQIVLSGDVDEDRLLSRLETLLAGLPAGTAAARPDPGPCRRPDGVETRRIERRQNQAVVLVGWPGPISPDEHRIGQMLLRELLNGQSGRLFESLRNRRSLCYNTGILGTAGFGQGMMAAYVLTAPDTATEAAAALVDETCAMADGPIGDEEFARARSRLLGGLLIAIQGNAAQASRASRSRIYGRPTDDLEQVIAGIESATPDLVRAAASAYLLRDARCEVFLGP
jgi:zinc protease